jgi:peptidoglycan/LPS O-acetylase OafA/YrhL
MKRHFHTFDALRFFAFFKVFLLHVPIVAFPLFNIFRRGGGIGVIFFFVLSGFLITYIILDEKNRTGNLNLYHFYVRRILRIWPLYYLMVAVAFATPYIISVIHISSSNKGYTPNWLMTLTFLENYKMIITNNQPNVSPLGVIWSLCIEEHFYLLWGILLYFINIKRIPVVLISAIIISNIFNFIFVKNNINTIEILTNIGYFAFGAMPAYWILNKNDKFESFILNIPNIYKYFLIVITLSYMLGSANIIYKFQAYIEPLIYGLLFSSLLCVIMPISSNIRIGDRNILSKLGIYTYGLYLYHTIIINLFIQVFKKLNLSLDKAFIASIFIVITLGTTIFVCHLSYKFFEKPILKLKSYFY